MQDPADYDLHRTPPEDHPPLAAAERSRTPWIVAAVLALVAVAGGYWLFRGGAEPPATVATEPDSVDVATDPVRPLGGEPMPGVVPELDESDAFVRELLRHLSMNPRIAAWLATDGLVRNFTVVVSNIAEGRTPAGHIQVLKPAGTFRVLENGEDIVIDPRSYARYNDIADAAASVDPSGTAEIYATLKPRIEEAHRELGAPEGTFDQTLERAIVQLLRTPVPSEPVRLRPVGIGYGYADERLQGLTAAQRHLLRMGPRNVRVIQGALRDIALELGIPAERLPPPNP
jgi:hypothetical protein